MAVQCQACAPVWKPTDRMAPADVVAHWRPPVVRLDLVDGGSLELTHPTVAGDSIVGFVTVRGTREPVAFAREDLAEVEPSEDGVHIVTPSGEAFELVGVWMRGDSIGGHRRIPEHGVRIAIGLTEVRRLQVLDVPDIASRLARGEGHVLLSPGERVRITHSGSGGDRAEVVVGWMERVTGDTLRMVPDGGSLLEVPLDRVLKLEVRIRAGSRALRGAGIGFGIAVALGLAGFAVYEATADCEGEACWVPGAVAIVGAGGLGLLAILIGTGVGAASLGEHWEEVRVDVLSGDPKRSSQAW